MAVNINSEEGKAVRKLVPLSTLPGPQYKTLCEDITIEEQDKGYALFNRGDSGKELVYLLSGDISLEAEGLIVETISAGSEYARFALAHQIPRKIDAIAKNNIRFLRIDPTVIKELVEVSSNKDSSMMDVEEAEETGGDWMTRLLQSPIFRLIPAANLQKILISLEEINVEKGEIIINQDDFPADYFYIIKQGDCVLTRKPSINAKEIKLAELKQGESFGEGSILSDKPRDVTVRALTDMVLLRLENKKFIELIREPVLKHIPVSSIRQEITDGAVLLDIRSADEYKKDNIEGSINNPFFTLRMSLKTLDRHKKTIIVCDDSKLSEAAAFILLRSRFDVYILEGGMESVQKDQSKSKASYEIENPNVESDAESVESETQTDIEAIEEAMPQPEELAAVESNENVEQENKLLPLQKEITLLKQQNLRLKQEKERFERQYKELLLKSKMWSGRK